MPSTLTNSWSWLTKPPVPFLTLLTSASSKKNKQTNLGIWKRSTTQPLFASFHSPFCSWWLYSPILVPCWTLCSAKPYVFCAWPDRPTAWQRLEWELRWRWIAFELLKLELYWVTDPSLAGAVRSTLAMASLMLMSVYMPHLWIWWSANTDYDMVLSHSCLSLFGFSSFSETFCLRLLFFLRNSAYEVSIAQIRTWYFSFRTNHQ
jgi:hypothetical protein